MQAFGLVQNLGWGMQSSSIRWVLLLVWDTLLTYYWDLGVYVLLLSKGTVALAGHPLYDSIFMQDLRVNEDFSLLVFHCCLLRYSIISAVIVHWAARCKLLGS
jgi:hypothetical protein